MTTGALALVTVENLTDADRPPPKRGPVKVVARRQRIHPRCPLTGSYLLLVTGMPMHEWAASAPPPADFT
ncbi:MAG TPA: hypothetical protein VGJ03_16895 [Acidimicrobiales bacterium]